MTGMVVNLKKTKVIVFNTGGPLKKYEFKKNVLMEIVSMLFHITDT